MFSFISRIQRKPESTKRQIAFFGAAGVTGIIALFWLVAILTGSLTFSTTGADKRADEGGPFSVLSDAVGGLIQDTTSVFSDLKNTWGGSQTVYPKEKQN